MIYKNEEINLSIISTGENESKAMIITELAPFGNLEVFLTNVKKVRKSQYFVILFTGIQMIIFYVSERGYLQAACFSGFLCANL